MEFLLYKYLNSNLISLRPRGYYRLISPTKTTPLDVALFGTGVVERETLLGELQPGMPQGGVEGL